MDDDIIREQIAYYRARADEYDEWFYRQGRYDHGEALNQQWFDEVAAVMSALRDVGPVGHTLELACGTGIWTRELAAISERVTALDVSPEVIAINQRKLPDDAEVEFALVDLFEWEPEQQYDLAFFGFWLSHVPPERLGGFLAKVGQAVRPGGRMFMVDSQRASASAAHDHPIPAPDDLLHQRKLNDGREFTVIKVYFDPDDLHRWLEQVGFRPMVKTTANYFFYAAGVKG